MRVRKLLALTLAMVLVLGSFTFAFGNVPTDSKVYAWEPGTGWQNSNITGWNEGDQIPIQVVPEDGATTLTVAFEYKRSNKDAIGFDNASGWFVAQTSEDSIDDVTPTTEVAISVSGPNLVNDQNIDRLEYEITITGDINGYSIYAYAHPSISGGTSLYDGSPIVEGASYWPGSTLHAEYVEANNELPFTIDPQELDYSMEITKVANPTEAYTGETVEYTITVTNVGNVDLEDVTIEDTNLGYTETEVDIPIGGSHEIKLYETYNTAGTYTNTAIATHTEAGQVSDDAIVVITEAPVYSMTIDKTVTSTGPYHPGDTINYGVTVTNTGNQTLTNIQVVDSMIGLDETITSLDPLATSEVFTGSYTATEDDLGNLKNIATATDDMADDVQDSETVSIDSVDTKYGVLTIKKIVKIDGEVQESSDEPFEFEVDGQTVFASKNNPGEITLPIGDYTVTEVNYGDWEPVEASKDVTVIENGTEVTFTNDYYIPRGNLLLTKNIYRLDGAVHEGVDFTLTGDGGTFTGTTNEYGTILFIGVPAGNYTLSETVPDGFTSEFSADVTIEPWQTNYVTDQDVGMPLYNNEVGVLNKMIENERIQYEYDGNTIKGYKLDSYENPIEDWTIELYDETGEELLGTTTTNEDGIFEFTGLAEGTYVVKEVMQEGWFNQTPISQTVVIEGSGDVEEGYYNLPGDNELTQIMPDSNVEFVAEGRIGDLSGAAEHELNIHTPPYNVEDEYRYFDWSNNGVPVPFTLDFDGTTVTYTVGGETLTYLPESVDDITDIMIRTRATKTDTGIMINNLVLNDTPLDGTSVAVGDTTGIDVLWLNGYDLSEGFTLEGESVMYWTSENMPMRSHLAFQIKVGNAENEGTFWTSPFMNEEEATITVYKEIDGTETQDPFNFRVYKGDEVIDEEEYIEAETSVRVGSPETIGLKAGTYTIAEEPEIEGYLLPDPYTFTIAAGEHKDITLTNTEIIPDRPSMTINKTVDDSSVSVNENVTYTIRVTNNGNIDLEGVWVTDELLDFEQMIELLEVGETETFTLTTSYSTTGEKVNTAVAEYGIETNDYIIVEDDATVDVNRRPSTNNTYIMKIDKVADGNFYEVGDTIEYTITVRNTGNSTLREILVTDDMTGLEETIDFLNQGASREFITTYVAQQTDVGDLTNTATAEDDRAGTGEATEIVTVEDIPEGVPGTYELEIEKTAVVEGDIFFGDMVEFEILVTNTGDETIENILVEDDMVDFEAVINKLKPGESKKFKVKVEAPKIPGNFVNVATATSTETGTIEDEDTVWVQEPIPLDVPDTGVAPTDLFFGLGALVSGLGVFFTKKRK